MNEDPTPVEAVTQLVLRERQSRDRSWWARMAECFTDDAIIEMSWYRGSATDFVKRSSTMDVGGSRGVHRLSPPAVHVHGDRALAELPLVIEFRTVVDGVEADLLSCARSQYRAVGKGGEWKLARITSIYERDTLTASIPGTRLNVAAAAFDGLRPSYRCLAWHLARSGYALPQDLLGDDRPDAVAAQYDAEWQWLLDSTAS